MTDVDAALVQQILDVSQRDRETNVQHHRQADDLLARLEIFVRVTFLHPGTLPSPLPRHDKTKSHPNPVLSGWVASHPKMSHAALRDFDHLRTGL